MTPRCSGIAFVMLTYVLLTPAAWAQAPTGTIAGAVTDTSGAVLPGVTVEAASPALIEQVRSVVTDAQGRYTIVELRPGVYSVTFSLPGFSTLRREGIELTAGFTAPVNAQLQVGALTETITVSGASPIVDIQNVRTQSVFSNEVLAALPNSRVLGAIQNFIPGVTAYNRTGWGPRDIGGTSGEAPQGNRAHGSDAGIVSFDGFPVVQLLSAFERRILTNANSIQEVVVESGGTSAEAWSGGVNMNVISKDGGNVVSGSVFGNYIPRGWDTNNLNDDLRARRLDSYNKQRNLYDIGGGFGGPLIKDKLWYFGSARWWGNENDVAGVYFNKPELEHTLFYQPDLTRPAWSGRDHRDASGRVTWQVAPKHKLVFSTQNTRMRFIYSTVNEGFSLPSGAFDYFYGPNNLVRAHWTNPATNRLLLEGGVVVFRTNHYIVPVPGFSPTDRSVIELSTGGGGAISSAAGRPYGAAFNIPYHCYPRSRCPWGQSVPVNGIASLSYVTGSHAFKVGGMGTTGRQIYSSFPNHAEQYVFFNQVPVSINQKVLLPFDEIRMKLRLNAYVQDQWTIDRLTLNLGLRFDHIHGYFPAQTLAPVTGAYLPNGISLPEVDNIPNFKAFHPRVGVAWDLFGNGKTALKAFVGSYEVLNNYDTRFTRTLSPMGSFVTDTSRTWNDANGNYVPDCDLQRKGANGECGAMSNQAFGTTVPGTPYAKDVTQGWNVSPNTWQSHVTLQQELLPRVAVTIGYFRTWYGNIRMTQNREVTAADFDPYCITAPADPRLPGGGGYPVCGLYDVSRAKFGRVDNLVVNSEKFGGRTQVFNGFDALINARFGEGGYLYGGLSTGQTVTDNCATSDVPAQFCKDTYPWRANTELKLTLVYPLPWWDLQTSVAYQNLPGVPQAASYVASNSEIAPSLGRNLAACPAATGPCNARAVVNLVAPNTLFEDRGNQVDVRVSKILTLGTRHRLQGNFDVFNLTNAADVIVVTNRYGPDWLKPNGIITGRLFKWSLQYNF